MICLPTNKSLPFAGPVTSTGLKKADKSLTQGSVRPAGRYLAEWPSFSLIRRDQHLYKSSISRQYKSLFEGSAETVGRYAEQPLGSIQKILLPMGAASNDRKRLPRCDISFMRKIVITIALSAMLSAAASDNHPQAAMSLEEQLNEAEAELVAAATQVEAWSAAHGTEYTTLIMEILPLLLRGGHNPRYDELKRERERVERERRLQEYAVQVLKAKIELKNDEQRRHSMQEEYNTALRKLRETKEEAKHYQDDLEKLRNELASANNANDINRLRRKSDEIFHKFSIGRFKIGEFKDEVRRLARALGIDWEDSSSDESSD